MNTVQEEAFVVAIESGSCWTRCIFINEVPVKMKLDTGADVTAIPEMIYR